ncbi:MAG: hypothetical protein BRC26_03145 [Nanohaloarchaea archaeon QH_8_44_6]|nr:MAG: hypothetical protein BRC26_03145 [Nanohaloarchaea archaeon QH_8_44_6]
MSVEQRVSDYKDFLSFDEEPRDASRSISEDDLSEITRIYDHLETMKKGVFNRITAEGSLKREEYGAGRALFDLQEHTEKVLSEYFSDEYSGKIKEKTAEEALDITRNEMTEEEYEAYKIVRNSWDPMSKEKFLEELPDSFLEGRIEDDS